MRGKKGAYKHRKSGLWAPPYSCTVGITQKTDDNWGYTFRVIRSNRITRRPNKY